MGVIAFLVVGLGITAVAAWFERRRRERTIARARTLAATHRFAVDVSRKPPPDHGFDQFDVGNSRRVEFQFWRPGEQDSVFQYQYTTGSGKHRQTHRLSCALLALPFTAPHTTIGPEGFLSRLGRAIGFRDVEVESPDFNDAYRVRSDDERFAITLLDHRMIGWLLRPESGRGALRFELRGPWLLCISSRLDLEQLFGYLDWAQRFRTHMPTVLASLYPPGR